MNKLDDNWYQLFIELQSMLKKPTDILSIKKLILTLHSNLHSRNVYCEDGSSYYDEITADISEDNFRICPTKRNMTIAWDLWHITRIEDITTSIFLCNDSQILNASWLEKLGTMVTDTGNAMTDNEVFSLSNQLSIKALKAYRDEVGKKTKAFIEQLTLADLKGIFSAEQTQRVEDEHCVVSESVWLKDFWGRKSVSGIITMPMTKHQIMHLNDCHSIVAWYNKKQK